MRKGLFYAPILCIDIGSRTQDALLYQPDTEPQNYARFVLPSPAFALSCTITQNTAAQRDIFIYGANMGGGFGRAVQAHLKSGFLVVMQPSAALALHDDLHKVEGMGVKLAETCPAWHIPLQAGDFNLDFWRGLMSSAALPMPETIVVAAQDHGYAPAFSNRELRMRLWSEFLATAPCGQGADPTALIYELAPERYTRLSAIQQASDGLVLDTAVAALLGLLSWPPFAEESLEHGVMAINAGNSHVVAFLVYKEMVYGVYEQHTGGVEPAILLEQLEKFRQGKLTDEEVRAGGGHGMAALSLPTGARACKSIYIVGPQREQLNGYGKMEAPYGDMMQNGCYGMLHGLKRLTANA